MTEDKHDILELNDVKLLVDSFYGKVRHDHLIGPIFDGKIQDRWPQHLAKMYAFWQTVLLGEHTYYGSPFPPHAQLPVEREHFNRWLALFSETINEHFSGKLADEALWRAGKWPKCFNINCNLIGAIITKALSEKDSGATNNTFFYFVKI